MASAGAGGDDGTAPRRARPRPVGGGTVLSVRPGKRRRKGRGRPDRPPPPAGRPGPPAVLSAVLPAPGSRGGTDGAPAGSDDSDDDGHDGLSYESDALLVLRSYTSSPHSGPCGLCPVLPPDGSNTVECVPFLTLRSLLSLLGPDPSRAGSAEADVRRMMRGGRAVGMQLIGTGRGGDGNDPGDVAVVESGAYLRAAGAALSGGRRDGRRAGTGGVRSAVEWIEGCLIPALGGRPHLPPDELGVLDAGMVGLLTGAGILAPRPEHAGGGCRLSLPGLGRCSRSVSACRSSVLRRLRAAGYGEVRRSRLEDDGGRRGRDGGGTFEQSGRFAVMDLLSIGAVEIRTLTEGGDQFVRLVDEDGP